MTWAYDSLTSLFFFFKVSWLWHSVPEHKVASSIPDCDGHIPKRAKFRCTDVLIIGRMLEKPAWSK